MAMNWDRSDGSVPVWARFVRPVFIILLTLLLFWLAMSMKRHHFMEGGRFTNRNGGTHP